MHFIFFLLSIYMFYFIVVILSYRIKSKKREHAFIEIVFNEQNSEHSKKYVKKVARVREQKNVTAL